LEQKTKQKLENKMSASNHRHHHQQPRRQGHPHHQHVAAHRPVRQADEGDQQQPERRMFTKLLKDGAATFRDARDAERFLRFACSLDTMEMLFDLVQSDLAKKRVTQAISHLAGSVQSVSDSVLPFLRKLTADAAAANPLLQTARKDLVETIFGFTVFLRQVNQFIRYGELSQTDVKTVALFMREVCHAEPSATETSQEVQQFIKLLQADSAVKHLAVLVEPRTSSSAAASSAAARLRMQRPTHDNEFDDFRRIQILPTAAEIACEQPAFLPPAVNAVDDMGLFAQTGVALLDRQFRLLREDMIGTVREKMSALTGDAKGKNGGKGISNDPSRVRNVKVRGISIEEHEVRGQKRYGDVTVTLTFEFPPWHAINRSSQADKIGYLERAKRILPKNSVVVILKNGNPLVFAEVRRREASEMARQPASIGVRPYNGDFEPLLRLIREGAYDHSLEMTVACPSFFSYAPILRSLQDLTQHEFPFPEELLAYSVADGHRLYTTRAVEDLPLARGLDTSQSSALRHAVDYRLSVVQGPPGTGKTFVGARIAVLLAQLSGDSPIVCLCYTNHALDQFLEQLLDHGCKPIARLGGGCKSERVKAEALQLDGDGGQLDAAMKRRQYQLIETKNSVTDNIMKNSERLTRTLGKNGWLVIKRYLSLFEQQQFEVPNNGYDGFQAVGADGKAIGEGYLWTLWADGKKPPAALRQFANYPLWKLSHHERKEQMRQWEEEHLREPNRAQLNTDLRVYASANDELEAIRDSKKLSVLRTAKVIGCTTTGASMYKNLLDLVRPRFLIVEEAGEVLEAHILSALRPHTERMVLIGDHKQLRPKIEQHFLSVMSGQGHNLNMSLFERLVKGGYPYVTLHAQHRMRPELSAVVRHMTYPRLMNHHSVLEKPSSIKGVKSQLVFVNHNQAEDNGESDDSVTVKSYVNTFESNMVTGVVQYLLQQGYSSNSIVVLTPYLGQLVALRKSLQDVKLHAELDERDINDLRKEDDEFRVEIGPSSSNAIATIDNFQGEESDIVIASLVRCNPSHHIGFLREEERVNVLFSRARFGLIVIGSADTLRNASNRTGRDTWSKLINFLDSSRCVYDFFPACCTQHANQTRIAKPDDFKNRCPDGGCHEICGAKLPCGHACPLRCHPDVSEAFHGKVKCSTVMSMSCRQGHEFDVPCAQQAHAKCRTCDQLADIARKRAQKEAEFKKKLKDQEMEWQIEQAKLDQQREEAERNMQLTNERQTAALKVMIQMVETDKLEKLRQAKERHSVVDLLRFQEALEEQARTEIAQHEAKYRMEKQKAEAETEAMRRSRSEEIRQAQENFLKEMEKIERAAQQAKTEAERNTARLLEQLQKRKIEAVAKAKADAVALKQHEQQVANQVVREHRLMAIADSQATGSRNARIRVKNRGWSKRSVTVEARLWRVL
jgi:hypothetical protein